MLFLILLTVVGVFYINWLYTRYHSTWKYLARFPGPIALPILGNVMQLGTSPEAQCRTVRCWLSQYKFDAFRLYAGPQPYVCVSNPKHFETVLNSTTILEKGDVYYYLQPWLGQGLLTARGVHWAKHRKMITPSFHFQILQDFLQIMNETTDRFMNLLNGFVKTDQIIDFQDIVSRSTLDIMCECAMGYRLNSIGDGISPIIKAISDLCRVITARILSAVKRSDFLFYFTADYKTQNEALQVLRKEFSKIIENRRKFLEAQNTDKTTTDDSEFKRPKMAFLDNLLTARIDGSPLTFQEIFEEVSTFLFEGHDTTASALGFIAYCLSRHPESQQKAFKEQLDIFGSAMARQPTYQELNDMKYLEMVIKETLRIFPSVPGIGRTTTTLTKLDRYEIPTGTTIMLMIIGNGVDPNYFDEPFIFRPERFDTSSQQKHDNPFSYVPFSAGPRNCIGQKFAIMEIKSTISKILRNFVILPAVDGLSSGIFPPHIQSKDPYDVKLEFAVTLKSCNGIQIRLQPRIYESSKL